MTCTDEGSSPHVLEGRSLEVVERPSRPKIMGSLLQRLKVKRCFCSFHKPPANAKEEKGRLECCHGAQSGELEAEKGEWEQIRELSYTQAEELYNGE